MCACQHAGPCMCQGHLYVREHTGQTPYQKITSGTCASKGMKPITEQSECNAAAPYITSAETKSKVTTRANRPEGCYELHGRFWLATNKANVGNGASGSRHPICKQQGGHTHTSQHSMCAYVPRAHCTTCVQCTSSLHVKPTCILPLACLHARMHANPAARTIALAHITHTHMHT